MNTLINTINSILILFFLVIYYININNKKNSSEIEYLINNLECKNVYKVFTVIVAVLYLYILYYINTKLKDTRKNEIFINELLIQQVIILVMALLWLPLTIMYLKKNNNKSFLMLGIMLVLFVMSSALYLYAKTLKKSESINNNYDTRLYKYGAYMGASLIFIHSSFLMLIVWSVNFFNR